MSRTIHLIEGTLSQIYKKQAWEFATSFLNMKVFKHYFIDLYVKILYDNSETSFGEIYFFLSFFGRKIS